ncbi:hypothetical protein K3G63_10930 [Hymenobacter sp. HSC-4F20]|uniref:hypothetical protein n=1 Tax=Hymenobacter sp. HSC-4F20 TaxID=2864135 RepID=UPI001C735825|nr:hypothetical protein [Hymenobacter sp. HSC-4F20]MBX0290956.1 hypothetical protein [Hymenobacter sp. HSC-4F20]
MAVLYTEEVASRAQAWLAASYSKRRTNEYIAELHALYGLITGNSAAGCTSCNFQGYVDLLTAYVAHFQRLQHPELMAKSAYSLAPGYENETFVHESYSEALKADNLTDKGAEFFIKNGFKHAFLKNGKPIEDEAPAEPKKLTPKQQAVADYKELFQTDPDEKLTETQLREAIDTKKKELDQVD